MSRTNRLYTRQCWLEFVVNWRVLCAEPKTAESLLEVVAEKDEQIDAL